MALGSNPVAVTSPSDFAPALCKEFLDIQATIECWNYDIFMQYYIVISGTLVGSFLDVLLLLLSVTLTGPHEKPRKNED